MATPPKDEKRVRIESAVQGSLFAHDFLTESVVELADWQALDDTALDELDGALRDLFERFPIAQTPNESQTEDDLIWPILGHLGWTASLRQQNLSAQGRDDVPDGLLFADAAAKDRANTFAEEWKRYEFGLAVVESKRWQRPLDRRSGRAGEQTAPSTQMLRYLRRVDDLTTGHLRWGILTNGAKWRLYYSGARSVSEQFFDLNLATVLDLPGHNDGLFALSEAERRHCLKLFALFFRREAFLPGVTTGRSLHQRVLDEGRVYEERVAADLSELVFKQLFPKLAQAIAEAAPDAPLSEVRDATLILLYRLLFILYAEDRSLLPVRDTRYDDYGLREKVRDDIRQRKDRDDAFSTTAARYWAVIDDLCRAIDQGDASIGLPPYNGGLFDRERTPLLARIRLGDQVMADVIDALSFEKTDAGRRYINYRDLSVQQLGSIYERLLEHELVPEGGQLRVRPNVFARKASGSYYTPADLVGLILTETLGPLVEARTAEQILELKVCDPAMGSGHFLVSLVDYLADRVITAMAEAEAAQDGYVSPLTERINTIRDRIERNAAERGWTIDASQLDDRHIVRRMVLKRCVYGVDKNPMAVELAKVSLWLHTFTVGAPLSFLDHHLRCGDSLFGCWVSQGIDRAMEGESALYLTPMVRQAVEATAGMQEIEALTDAEIAEAHRSSEIFNEVHESTAPLDAFLSLSHGLDWLHLKDRQDVAAVRAFSEGSLGDPVQIALGEKQPRSGHDASAGFASILAHVRKLDTEERFLHWQVAFPGVWSDWERPERRGGFDAVIGNPPWDRIKLQQVEWFAARRPAIAHAQRAADRKRMIAALQQDGDPLAAEFERANNRAAATAHMARACGDYPLLSRGDINLYSLFVERAMALVKPDGMVGLLVPSGIASDKTAAPFFQSVATQGRLKALYDFENKKVFFPDVHASFKFCVFVASPSPVPEEEREGAWSIGNNRFNSPSGEWVPLYEGKMVQAFDHRAANVQVNPANQHRPAQPVPATLQQHQDPDWLPDPQFWLVQKDRESPSAIPELGWLLGFKDVTAPTNARAMIAALIPSRPTGNTLPVLTPSLPLLPVTDDVEKITEWITEVKARIEWHRQNAFLLLANLNSTVLDFVARQKVQGQHLNWFIVEQLPVVPPDRYNTVHFGSKTAGEIVRDAVLELTYTAHDMAPFARDLGHVDEAGQVKPPFVWDEDRRLHLRAKLDAVFFHLYGVTDRDDVRYIYATFPIVERQEKATYSRYRSRDLCLAWMNALAAGHPDAEVEG